MRGKHPRAPDSGRTYTEDCKKQVDTFNNCKRAPEHDTSKNQVLNSP